MVCEDLGRNEDDLVIRDALRGEVDSGKHVPDSSTDAGPEAEVRLFERVIVFGSLVFSRLDKVALASPMDERRLAVKAPL